MARQLHAQKTTHVHPGKAGSPHVRTEWTIDGANLSIEYGRPSLKGRVPGKDIDPYDGREWRTGADEATTLKTDKTLEVRRPVACPRAPTRSTRFPTGGTWHLMVSKKTGQWGIPYPKGEDLGRAPMTLGKAPAAAEQLTISDPGHAGRRHAPHRLGHHPRQRFRSRSASLQVLGS